MTKPKTIDYTYSGVVTTVALPAPLRHRYTKGQQSLVDAVVKLGWSLDETAIINTYGNHFDLLSEERRLANLVQHPFVFVREDADGGWWELELDYVSREFSWYSHGEDRFNKALLGAKLRRFTAEADEVTFDDALSGYASYSRGRVVLQKQSNAGWASYNYVTGVATDGERYTLREQVLALATDPGLVLWLAAERRFTADEAKYAAQRAKADREAAEANITAGWADLKAVARQVASSHGLSDHAALVAALKTALAAVEDEVVVR